MKKYRLMFFLLIVFVMCACTNTLSEELPKTDKETVVNENKAEKKNNELNSKEINASNDNSITFRGEVISAPISFPNVPEQYIPVLNDFYLYTELEYRYLLLMHEDKVAPEITDEYELLAAGIRERGYISAPHGSRKATSGYALIDLEHDGIPELLLLDNDSQNEEYIYAPAIFAIFSIRDGQLVCIENSSDLIDKTALSAEGILYQSEYDDSYIKTLCLKSDQSKLSIISEVWLVLSFDGDIPVPHWIKKENENESNISESEFDELMEKREDAKEWMKTLNFIALYPDRPAIPYYTKSKLEEEIPELVTEYPKSYQDAPSEYNAILDDFYLLAKSRGEERFYEGLWDKTDFSEYPYGEFAYAVADINDDGVLELLLGDLEGLTEDASPNLIYTLKEGKPDLLMSFTSRSSGTISADGMIHYHGSDGAGYTTLGAYEWDDKEGDYVNIAYVYSDYSDEHEKPFYVQMIDGKKHYISKAEFDVFWEKPSQLMELIAIPIISE